MDNLKKALESAMQKDIGRYENTEHEFSEKFESEMKKLSDNVSESPKKGIRFGRRLIKVAAAVAAAVALFATGTLAGAVSSGFNIARTTYHGLPGNLFTVSDTEGCPTTIETVYTLGGFPSGLTRIYDYNDDKTSIGSRFYPGPLDDYYNDELYAAKIIFLDQDTKESFKFKYADMEYITYKSLTVNGGQAYFITQERYYGTESFLIWESEDYIFTLYGSFSEERAVELAGSLVVYNGEIPFNGLEEAAV